MLTHEGGSKCSLLKENGRVSLCQVFAGPGSMQMSVCSKIMNFVGQVILLNVREHSTVLNVCSYSGLTLYKVKLTNIISNWEFICSSVKKSKLFSLSF